MRNMICRLFRRVRDLPFSTKLIAVYVFSLLLGIGLNTYEQIDNSLERLRRERIESLDMLTEQVALNFSDSQQSMNDSIYARLRAFEIPALMNAQNSQPEKSSAALQYALAQTISESTEYDYVALQTAAGQRFSTKINQPMTNERYGQIAAFSDELLDSGTQERFDANTWVRSSAGDVYIITNVYNTSPLKWVGLAVFHLKGSLFSLSEAYESTGFAFFDADGKYLSFVGMSGDAESRAQIVRRLADETQLLTQSEWEQDYFVSHSRSGSWQAMGFSPKSVYREMRNDSIRIGVIYGCLALIAGIVLMLILVRSLVRKLRRIQYSMDQVADGNLDSHIEITDNDNISQIAKTFNHMMHRMKELLAEVAEKERQKKDAELQIMEYKYRSLETQIRPHFIYNAFEIVNAMAKIKGETEIVEIVQRISRYFRNITVSTTRQFITTQQEFDALRDYTEIYRFIHGERLSVTFSAREAARNAMIPTMIVQPIVENALKHGVRNQDEDSQIIVHAYIREDKLHLTVKDSGCGLTPEQEERLARGEQLSSPHHGGIGLENVRQRLRLLYADEAGFSIQNRPEGGVVVRIVIPLSYSEPTLHFGDEDLQ